MKKLIWFVGWSSTDSFGLTIERAASCWTGALPLATVIVRSLTSHMNRSTRTPGNTCSHGVGITFASAYAARSRIELSCRLHGFGFWKQSSSRTRRSACQSEVATSSARTWTPLVTSASNRSWWIAFWYAASSPYR